MAALALRDKVDKFLHEKNAVGDVLAVAEEKTGVKRLYLFSGVVACLFTFLLTGVADHLIVSLIGFLYPAYASVRAIQSKNKEDDTKWLIYWVVYGGFVVLEILGDLLLNWFPMYFLFKCSFLVWCMSPIKYNGSMVIYYRCIEPVVQNHGDEIGNVIKGASKKAGELLNEAESKAREVAADVIKTKDN